MLEQISQGSVYRNKKNGQLYTILHIGMFSERIEGFSTEIEPLVPVVVYMPLYDSKHKIWVRPLRLFMEKFEEPIEENRGKNRWV